MLFVLDGSKALRKAVRAVFGEVPVQRCLWHKERNVLGHLPERDRPPVKARLRRAWRETDYDRALEQLTRLADELERTHPGAAGSLRERMQETLTVIRLGTRGKLRRTLESTNPCESMIDTVRTTQRNVKHWSSGEMGLRWTAAGTLEAEKQFRKIIGYTQLPQLAVAIERRLHLPQPNRWLHDHARCRRRRRQRREFRQDGGLPRRRHRAVLVLVSASARSTREVLLIEPGPERDRPDRMATPAFLHREPRDVVAGDAGLLDQPGVHDGMATLSLLREAIHPG
jgi:Transposase, Mutator family